MEWERRISLLWIVFAVTVVIVFSCNRPDRRVAEWLEFYKDSAFIEIPGNSVQELLEHSVDYSPLELGKGNHRLMKTRYIDGDTLCLGVSCGADVRVSENIYEYMMWITMDDNLKLRMDTIYEIRLTIPDSCFLVVRKDYPDREWLMKISGPVPGMGEAPKR